MYNIGLVLQEIVNTFNDIPFSEHVLVPHRHKPILHCCFKSVYQMNAVFIELLKESLLDISLVCEYFSIKHFCKDRPYLGISVIYIGLYQCERYDFSPAVT